MSIFKCKMCGGTIEFEQGATVGICDSCGTKQTLPKLDDDRRSNLYDRANHFRRNNEFDKAAGIYEQILNEDTTDAEAYWSLVLCHYGIEYVEDPKTHHRVPTVNRAQFTSIFDDENYKSAIQYADISQRVIYEEEATSINEIQKGILAISQKEEPFDVFICYKETDNNGRRTPDSVLANDLYHQLTQEGFKVFFSRITLEDKLGTAYEPYIFAALNSAKVMVVLGTRAEYFNAVWVKNEWSRYLSIVKQSGGKKVLIPAYRDMDPYDLPEEFSHLQAQDMSKLGFMQDLIRGIKKITEADVPQQAEKETVVIGGNANIAPLLKRAFMFLEDGEWTRADEFCEQVLNQDPENAQAYLGKLMAELNVRRQEELPNCAQPFDNSNNYQKAVRFGSDEIADILSGYITHINDRNENERLTSIYNQATNAMNVANTESAYKSAAEIFKTVPGFKDADALAGQCLEKAEICHKDAIYATARSKMTGDRRAGYEDAIKIFRTIIGWKDTDEQIDVCQRKIEEIETGIYERAASAMNVADTEVAYKAVADTFKTIPGFKDADALAEQCLEKAETYRKDEIYASAKSQMISESITGYETAIKTFSRIAGWKDADEQINVCQRKIEEIKEKEEADRIEHERQEEERRIAAEKAAKKRKKIIAIVTPIIVACIAFVITLIMVIIPNQQYKEAIGKYSDSIKVASVGDTIKFGHYEQDNNSSNGKEEIEWIVLAKDGDKVLVISKYALDNQQYNSSFSSVTWETCSLRKWMNGSFLNSAFDSGEQKLIQKSTVTADQNPSYSTSPGNNTTDKVFLLSITEVNKYLSSYPARKCAPTDYAKAQGAHENSDTGNCWWCLRTSGGSRYYVAEVSHIGSVDDNGNSVDSRRAVRPALCINLN